MSQTLKTLKRIIRISEKAVRDLDKDKRKNLYKLKEPNQAIKEMIK